MQGNMCYLKPYYRLQHSKILVGNDFKICPHMYRQIQVIRKEKNRYILEGTEAWSDSFVCNDNQLHLIHIMKIQTGK